MKKRWHKILLSLIMVLAIAVPGFAADGEGYELKPRHGHFLNKTEATELSQLSFITTDINGVNHVYFKMFSGISVSDYIRLKGDLIKIRDYTDIRRVNLLLNSPGGSAFDGLSIADTINRAQNEWGFTFSVQASGIVASAAVPIFAVCKFRSASPGTIFMVHEAALWKWPGRETTSDIIAQGELMKLLQSTYLSYLVNNSTTSLAKWSRMEKATTWFSTEEARKLGLIERDGVNAYKNPSKPTSAKRRTLSYEIENK